MTVYFVYRSHYHGPTGKYIKRFEEDSVLSWFQNNWQGELDKDQAYNLAKTKLGCSAYGFWTLFEAIAEKKLAVPQTTKELGKYLQTYINLESSVMFSPHIVQVRTDDDEIDLGYLFFDDHFLANHANKASYLLYDNWQLPVNYRSVGINATTKTTAIAPGSNSAGNLYMVFLAYYDSCNFSDLEGGYQIEGIRLPDFCRYLTQHTPAGKWPFELKLIRSQLLKDNVDNSLESMLRKIAPLPIMTLGGIYTDDKDLDQMLNDLIAKKDPSSWRHNSAKSLIQVDTHVAQICLHTEVWNHYDMFHRWIFFDDLWLKAHSDLGNAILSYAANWNGGLSEIPANLK